MEVILCPLEGQGGFSPHRPFFKLEPNLPPAPGTIVDVQVRVQLPPTILGVKGPS